MVGNDIVDLHFVDRPPYQHVGHLERVCTSEELRYIRDAKRPSVALTALWAAKEAAYKLFSRQTSCPFVPKQFVVRLENPVRLDATETAIVSYGGTPIRVEISTTNDWVHATAVSPAAQVVRWTVCKIERPSGGECQPLDESEAVRSMALELASIYCEEDVRLNLQGRIPILINKEGTHVTVDVSFSHHGKFGAVAMAWPIGEPGRVSRGSRFAGGASSWEETCSTCTA